MSAIYVIRNVRPGVIYLPSIEGMRVSKSGGLKTGRSHIRDMQALQPGDNEVPAEYWDACKGNPAFDIWVRAGWLKKLRELGSTAKPAADASTDSTPNPNPHTPSSSVPAPTSLAHLDEAGAFALIANTSDRELLSAWGQLEERKDVVRALVDKYAALGQ